MPSERVRVSALATWIGQQLKTLRVTLRDNVAPTTDRVPKMWTEFKNYPVGGALTFTIPAGYFTNVVFVAAEVLKDTAAPAQATVAVVRSRSNTTVTVQVFESKTTGVLVLNTSVEGMEVAATAGWCQLLVVGY